MPNMDSKAVAVTQVSSPQREWKIENDNATFKQCMIFLPDGKLVFARGRQIQILDPVDEKAEPINFMVTDFSAIVSMILLTYQQLILLDEQNGLWHFNVLTREIFHVTLRDQAYATNRHDYLYRVSSDKLALRRPYNDKVTISTILDANSCIPALQNLELPSSADQQIFYSHIPHAPLVAARLARPHCTGLVTSVMANCVFQINDRYAMVGHSNEQIYLLDMQYDYCLGFFEGEPCGVAIDFGLVNGGESILSVHQKGWQIWNLAERMFQRAFITENNIKLFQMLPDGQHFIIVWENSPNVIELWDVDAVQPLDQHDIHSEVFSLAVNHNLMIAYSTKTQNGCFFFPYLTAYYNKKSLPEVAACFDTPTATTIVGYLNADLRFQNPSKVPLPVLDVITTPHQFVSVEQNNYFYCVVDVSNEIVMYGQRDGTLRLNDTSSLQEIHRFRPYNAVPELMIKLAADFIACYYQDATICIFDLHCPTVPLLVQKFNVGLQVDFMVEFYPHQLLVASFNKERGSKSTGISVWNYLEGRELYTLPHEEFHEFTRFMVSHLKALFYCQRRWVEQRVYTTLPDQTQVLRVQRSSTPDRSIQGQEGSALVELSDNTLVGAVGRKLYVWSQNPTQRVATFDTREPIVLLKAMPDGQHFCGSSNSNGGDILLWHVERGLVDSVFIEEPINQLTVLSDGRVAYQTSHCIGVIDFSCIQTMRKASDAIVSVLPKTIADSMGAPEVIGHLTKAYLGKGFCFWRSPFTGQPPAQQTNTATFTALPLPRLYVK